MAAVTAGLLILNFFAGAAVFLSPCGFPMLPAYLAYYLERQVDTTTSRDAGLQSTLRGGLRGLAGGLVAALGALLVLGTIAALALWLGAPFKRNVIHLELVGGLIVIGLGAALLVGKDWTIPVPVSPVRHRGMLGLFTFGALYAAVGAGCVVPVFLGVLLEAAALPPPQAVLALGAYALGATSLLVAATVAVGATGAVALAPLRKVLPYTKRVGGLVMIVVGIVLIDFWWRTQYGV